MLCGREERAGHESGGEHGGGCAKLVSVETGGAPGPQIGRGRFVGDGAKPARPRLLQLNLEPEIRFAEPAQVDPLANPGCAFMQEFQARRVAAVRFQQHKKAFTTDELVIDEQMAKDERVLERSNRLSMVPSRASTYSGSVGKGKTFLLICMSGAE